MAELLRAVALPWPNGLSLAAIPEQEGGLGLRCQVLEIWRTGRILIHDSLVRKFFAVTSVAKCMTVRNSA
jgi:hypothetical protein